MPDNIALPFPFSSQRTGEVQRAGPYPAFLGNQFNPHFTASTARPPRRSPRRSPPNTKEFDEPYAGIAPDCVLRARRRRDAGPHARPPEHGRKSLLDQLEDARRARDEIDTRDPFREMAYSLIGSEKVRQALDVRRESGEGARATGTSCSARVASRPGGWWKRAASS